MEVRKSQNLRDVINEWPLFLLDKFSKSKDSFSNVQNKRQTMFLFFTFSLININYCNHLNTRLVWYSNDRFLYGCQMVRYSNGGLKKACLRSKMSGIQTVPQTTWIYHLNTGHHTVRYSDGYCTAFCSNCKHCTESMKLKLESNLYFFEIMFQCTPISQKLRVPNQIPA